MENLPIKETFGIVKWWTGLKTIDKLVSFLVSVIIALATVSVRLYGTNAVLQKENLSARVECEQRVLTSVTWQRNRDDSIRAQDNKDCELEKQAIYGRAPLIEKRNEKMHKALQ